MSPESAGPWLAFLLGPAGLTVGLLGLVWALYTEKLVPGVTHRRVRDERDAAVRLLNRAMSVTGRAVEVVDSTEKRRGD